MEINVHHYYRGLEKLEHKIDHLIKTINKMPTKAEFEAAFARQSAAILNLADDIRRLLLKQSAGGLSEAEEQEILNKLNGDVDKLEALAGQTPEEEPEPPVEPEA